MINFSTILNYIISVYPYFSLFYLILFWKKIKSIAIYKAILGISNLIFVVLSLSALSIIVETFTAWYSGNMYEHYAFASRVFGFWGLPFFYLLSAMKILIPQLFWFKKLRTSLIATITISIIIIFPIYLENLIPIISSFHKDFLPSKWVYTNPWYNRYFLTPILQAITYGSCVMLVVLIKNKITKQ